MTFWRKLLVLTALPGLAAAADPALMNLVMPDATTVMEINLARIMASPVGEAIRDAFHQGLTTQLNTELAKSKPQFQEQIAALSQIDWSQAVRDIVIARGSGKQPSTLFIAQASLDLAQLRALPAFSGESTVFEGVPILVSAKAGNGAIAFLNGSIVVIGQIADVKSAIHRRSQHTPLPKALAARMARYSADDIWLASTELITGPLVPPSAAKSPAAAQMTQQVTQFIEKVAGLNGGLRFSPDFDLAADLEAHTEKGAAELAQGLRWVSGMAQSQAKNAGPGAHGAEGLKCQLSGKHILLSLHVPEAQMRAGLQQMRQAQMRAGSQLMRRPAVVAARPAQTVLAPSSGVPPPPPGTMRVQSSEMGTVLIPVGKQP